MMMIWSCWWCWWWYEAERDLSFDECSLVCFFCFFWIFHQNLQQLTPKRRILKESLKSVNDERRGFFKPKPLFFTRNCQKVHEKETTQTHRRDQQTNVFPQHHKNYATSIIMFASSFNAVRSSPSIISKNVSSKSSRSSSNRSSTVKVRAMGMKKGSLLFSFSSSRRNPSHLISSFSKMDVFLSLFLFRWRRWNDNDEQRSISIGSCRVRRKEWCGPIRSGWSSAAAALFFFSHLFLSVGAIFPYL